MPWAPNEVPQRPLVLVVVMESEETVSWERISSILMEGQQEQLSCFVSWMIYLCDHLP